MKISTNKQNFTNISKLASPLGVFYNPNAAIPTLLIETGVTLGRSYEANKRGGKVEASERLVEQGASALIWIYGVNFLKNLGEKTGKALFKFKDLDFDIGFDELRNPLENSLNNINKTAAKFKMINLLASTALATGFIGFILPKINHKITNFILKKDKSKKQIKTLAVPDFSEYRNSVKNKKNLSFTSSFLNSFAHTIENNSSARLFITDAGVISGRYQNGRNKYEKIEGLFRDISSIYLYLRATKDIVKVLNKLTNNTNINPKALECLLEELSKNIKDNVSKEEFLKRIKEDIKKEDLEKLNELFKNKKVIALEEFDKVFNDKNQKSFLMSNLQPLFNDKRFLSYTQAKDVLNSSLLSNPEFLKDTFNKITKGKSDNPKKFVSKKFLEEQRKSLYDFSYSILSKVKGDKITKKDIENIAKNTLRKNFIFYCAATLISTYALGIIIPKIQYFITKKLTKQNKFPALEEYK